MPSAKQLLQRQQRASTPAASLHPPQVTHPPHAIPAATPAGGPPLHARPAPGPAQAQYLNTQAPQGQSQPPSGTQTPSVPQPQQQVATQPSVMSLQPQPALPTLFPPAGQKVVPAGAALPAGQRAFPQTAPAPMQPLALPTPLTGGRFALSPPCHGCLPCSCN